MNDSYTATDLQRKTFEALKAAKALGCINIHHRELGDFQIIPQEPLKKPKRKFGTLARPDIVYKPIDWDAHSEDMTKEFEDGIEEDWQAQKAWYEKPSS
ncbi:MAG: hypothetical protein ACPGRX_03390 [Bdellovibrionales bacterium]